MKSSRFVSKFLVGSIFISIFSPGIVNAAEQNPNRAYGGPDRFFPSPYSHRPIPNVSNKPCGRNH